MRNGTVYFYYADMLGTIHTITNGTGTACYDATFTPYGQEMLNPNISQTCSSNYKFTGYEYDSETGLYYAKARYYNLRLGRFMSADAMAGGIADPQSLNRYAYVTNKPLALVDPIGLCGEPDLWDPSTNTVTGFLPCYLGGGSGGGGMGGGATGCTLVAVEYVNGVPHEGAGCGHAGGGQGIIGNNKPRSPAHPYLNCVANSGNEASLQGLLGLGNSKIAGAFLGNPISDLIQLFSGNGGSPAAADAGVYAATKAAQVSVVVPFRLTRRHARQRIHENSGMAGLPSLPAGNR
jgi:RHS repeat-associated protein